MNDVTFGSISHDYVIYIFGGINYEPACMGITCRLSSSRPSVSPVIGPEDPSLASDPSSSDLEVVESEDGDGRLSWEFRSFVWTH